MPKLTIAGVDVTKWIDRDHELRPLDSDLGNQIAVFTAQLETDPLLGAIPVSIAEGQAVQYFDDDLVTQLYGGKIAVLKPHHRRARVQYRIECQSHEARFLEMSTGPLDRSAIIDTDRNHVIAAFQSALQAKAFGVGTLDDSIYTKNAPNWTGIKGTAAIAGKDWSYKALKDVMADILGIVPNVYWRIKPDETALYGPVGDDVAPFILSKLTPGTALPAGVEVLEEYDEETYLTGHRNKLSRGGAGASTATAFDESSYAKYGKVFEDPYKNDTTIPSADLRRLTYAELQAKRVKMRAKLVTRAKGLAAGQLVDVLDDDIDDGSLNVPWIEAVFPLMARSDSGLLSGERGPLLIQKVTTEYKAPGNYLFHIEAGDYVRDFPLRV
jgi:hypothetical protein